MTYSGMGRNSRGFLFGKYLTNVQSLVTGLTVLLDPNGGVQAIYVDTVNQRRIFLGPPVNSLQFLLGKTDKAGSLLPTAASIPQANIFANIDESNLADGNALWVAVSRATGQVTTTENMPSMDKATALATPNPVNIGHYLTFAREAATYGEHMTGR
jgi:hypothetical protein